MSVPPAGTFEIRLELLLDRRVVDQDGRTVGRVQEIMAERDETGGWVVREVLVGPLALFRRLATPRLYQAFRQLFKRSGVAGYRIPWNRIDLTDPRVVRLRCSIEDLQELSIVERSRRRRLERVAGKIGVD